MHSALRRYLTALAAGISIGLAGCGGGYSSSDVENGPGENEVHVIDNAFEPSTLTVAPGATVTLTWVGSQGHNVTFTPPNPAPLSNSATQSSGTHVVTVPSEPGEYPYECTIHVLQGMTGVMIVEE